MEVFFEAAFLGAAFFVVVLALAVFFAAFFEAPLVAGLFLVVAFLLAFDVAFLVVFFLAAAFFAAGFFAAVFVAPARLVPLAFLVELAEDFVAVFLRVVGRCLAAIGGVLVVTSCTRGSREAGNDTEALSAKRRLGGPGYQDRNPLGKTFALICSDGTNGTRPG